MVYRAPAPINPRVLEPIVIHGIQPLRRCIRIVSRPPRGILGLRLSLRPHQPGIRSTTPLGRATRPLFSSVSSQSLQDEAAVDVSQRGTHGYSGNEISSPKPCYQVYCRPVAFSVLVEGRRKRHLDCPANCFTSLPHQ